MREVVKRTRLWQLEKIDVAQELIAHFQDGLEAGSSPEDLATHFGNTRSTARLIRRAKKRKRPMAWHMMRWMSWSFAAIVALYMGLAVILFTGKPSIDVDYLAKLNRRAAAVPEDQRAWPLYRKAMIELGITEDRNRLNDLYRHGSIPSNPRWDDTVRFLNNHQASIELLRLAGTKPGLGLCAGYPTDEADRVFFGSTSRSNQGPPPVDEILIHVAVPPLGIMRHAARLLGMDAQMAFINKDSHRAYRDLIAILSTSNHIAENPTLISGLTAISIAS